MPKVKARIKSFDKSTRTTLYGPGETGGDKRLPPVSVPGSSGPTRSAPQKGGGGNKGAGSPEVTAASAPTVTVSNDGTVTAEHFGPNPSAQKAAKAAVAAQKAQVRKVKRIVALVNAEPQKSSPVTAKGTAPKPSLSSKLGATGKVVSSVADTLSNDITKAKKVVEDSAAYVAKAPKTKTSEAFGQPTLGTPKVKEVLKAKKEGRLQTKGGVTSTPKARKAQKKVVKAKARVAKTSGISGPITPAQKVFAEQVAKETGLSPRVVAAQALAEESGSAATGREAEGNNDWLNIGYYDSGPGAITKTPEWKNPHTAAKATSEFFKDRKFGPSSSIANIVPSSAGKSDAAQIAAIGNSDWASSGAYRESIEGTHQLISGGDKNPKAIAKLKAAEAQAAKLGIKPPKAESQKQQQVNYLKVFGKEVGLGLKAVTKSKSYTDESSTKAITIKGPKGGTLVRNVQGSSGVATVIDKNKDPEIAARLLLLSRKTGKTIYINSAYRTPAQSEEVGGFPDDPHTKGEAMDIGVNGSTIESANSISEAEYESVGLYRPFGSARGGSSAEDNHVQLLNDGTPATGSTSEGSTSASSSAPAATLASSPSSGAAPVINAATFSANQTKANKRKVKVKRLSAPQRIAQVERILATGDLAAGKGAEAASTSTLDKLAKKYGAAA